MSSWLGFYLFEFDGCNHVHHPLGTFSGRTQSDFGLSIGMSWYSDHRHGHKSCERDPSSLPMNVLEPTEYGSLHDAAATCFNDTDWLDWLCIHIYMYILHAYSGHFVLNCSNGS